MNWKVKILLIIILFILFYIIAINFLTPVINKDKIFLDEIFKLEQKIDSLNNQKDSIKTVIDSTHIKIITNEKYYQEKINIVITQPSDSDFKFITEYARQHRNKRISNNMFRTSETK